jgi:hypothetical protein
MQKSTLFKYVFDKEKNPATQESCASSIDYINGLEEQQAIMDK